MVGEGGSGGAIALATGDRVLMMGHAVYSVISPEGCASILWRNPARARDAAEAITLVSTDPSVQILAVVVLLIVIGMFIDVLPAIVVSAPVLAPALIQLGFDPLHVGMVMLLALNLGNITPPVGMTIMTAARIAGVPYEAVIRQSLPFMVSHLVVIVLAALLPDLVLWFPRLIGAI